MLDSKALDAIQRLMNSQAQLNLVKVDSLVKAGNYVGPGTITYGDGSKIYIDFESKSVVSTAK
jgi:hypothetical protein